MPDEADDILIRRSQQGDRAAFEALIGRTSRLVFSRAYLATADIHRAEDLTQEVFLSAWKAVGQVDKPEGFRTWLLAILQSVIVDAGRRQSRKKRNGQAAANPEVLFSLASGAPSPQEQLELREKRMRVVNMLNALPEEQRLALTLRYIGGLDYKAIEQQLSLSNGSLRGLLGRGLAVLREKMSKEDA
jgi:RNA polymerase sigma-70 factor, ECF subfamily